MVFAHIALPDTVINQFSDMNFCGFRLRFAIVVFQFRKIEDGISDERQGLGSTLYEVDVGSLFRIQIGSLQKFAVA